MPILAAPFVPSLVSPPSSQSIPEDPTPEFGRRLACALNADGAIARGYRIERCELQGEAKTNFAGTIGSSLDEAVAPGLITVGLTKDPHQMQVHT